MTVTKGDIAEAIASEGGKGRGEYPGTGQQGGGQMMVPATGMQSTRDTLTIGAAYCIRTVTIACIGKLVGISNLGPNVFLHLDNYVWVADFGEYKQALATGKLQKAESLPGVIPVAVAPIVDIHPWNHPLKAS
jgi:hypothetical protein